MLQANFGPILASMSDEEFEVGDCGCVHGSGSGCGTVWLAGWLAGWLVVLLLAQWRLAWGGAISEHEERLC